MIMNVLILGYCAALFLFLQEGANSPSQNFEAHSETAAAAVEPPNRHKEKIPQRAEAINKEQAIAIAKKEALKTHQLLNGFDFVACERRSLWLVILDSGGPEYYISKDSGKVLLIEQLQAVNDDASISGNKEVSRAEAITIAKKDFLHSKDERTNLYDAVACELSKTWRVFFEYRIKPRETLATVPNADPPSYIISKKTGKILHKRCCS